MLHPTMNKPLIEISNCINIQAYQVSAILFLVFNNKLNKNKKTNIIEDFI